MYLINFNKKYFQFGWYPIQLDIVHDDQEQGCMDGQNLLSMTIKNYSPINSDLAFILF